MTETLNDPWQFASERVAEEASRLLPFAYSLLIALIVWVGWEEIGEPFASAVGSEGYYTLDEAKGHVAANLVSTLPVFGLMWALAELCLFLRDLSKQHLWRPGVTRALFRLGCAVVLTALTAAFVVPQLKVVGLVTPPDLSSINLAVIALGLGLILLERLLQRLLTAAKALREETQSFI